MKTSIFQDKEKSVSWIFVFLITFLSLLISVSSVYAKVIDQCPADDTYLNEDTLINISGPCHVKDKGKSGVLRINSSGITLNCNGFELVGSFETHPEDAYKFGIFAQDYGNATIKNCVIKNYGDGILMFESNNNSLINNTLVDNFNGIVIDNGTKNKIYNNSFSSNVEGVLLLPVATDNYIYSNHISKKGGVGIEIEGSYGNIVSNNTFQGINGSSSWRGIWERGEPYENTIVNNAFEGDIEILRGFEENYESHLLSFGTVKPEPQYLRVIEEGSVKFEKVFTPPDAIQIPEGNYTFEFSAEGYDSLEKEVIFNRDMVISSNLIDRTVKVEGNEPKTEENVSKDEEKKSGVDNLTYVYVSIVLVLIAVFIIFKLFGSE